jgi:hypothetical protein
MRCGNPTCNKQFNVWQHYLQHCTTARHALAHNLCESCGRLRELPEQEHAVPLARSNDHTRSTQQHNQQQHLQPHQQSQVSQQQPVLHMQHQQPRTPPDQLQQHLLV